MTCTVCAAVGVLAGLLLAGLAILITDMMRGKK
jgi:hypothetical protein